MDATLGDPGWFGWLPLDVLRHFVKRYLRPLDYHRALRCGTVFHVLTDQERIEKEYERQLAKRTAVKRICPYQRTCEHCGFPIGKNKARRLAHVSKCEGLARVRQQIVQQEEQNRLHYVRRLSHMCVGCLSCESVSTFLFPAWKRRHTCTKWVSSYVDLDCDDDDHSAWCRRWKQLQWVRERKRQQVATKSK